MSREAGVGVLSGIRVVDFGHHAAGPLAARLLAQQGAEVIHVDRPGGPAPGTPDDAFLNRGKQRVTLDLKDAGDRARAEDLIASADVLIENFRPGVMARLGLGQEALCQRFPRLVYASLPGFAASDPRAGLQAWEGIVSAAAGLYCATSPAGALPADAAPFNALPLASNFAAFHAVTAIVMALIARERSGHGQWIEAPLFDACIELLGPALPETFPNYTIIYGGGIYACAEGHVFLNANNPRFLFWLLDAAGVTPQWRADGLLERECINGADRARNAELRRRMAALFATRTAEEWQEFAALHHVPLARIATLQQWQHSVAARDSGAVVAVQDPRLGTLLQPGDAVEVVPATAASGVDPPPCAVPVGGGGALAGVRVLDLANILAGPSVGRWLADFGAEVIKINDPKSLSVAMHDYLNRGKKSALVDVKTPEGRDVILRLAAVADVFLSNFPEPTAQRYGLREQDVRASRADIVYASVSCYGSRGPWRARRGYEPQAQACTGMMAGYGGAQAPVMLPQLVNDYGTGILGAFAVGLALYARLRDGRGRSARAALAATATLHQWGHFGPRFAQRLWRAADGWLFIAAAPAQHAALARLLGSDEQQVAAARVALDSVATWLARCGSAGIAAMPLATQREAMQHPYALGRGVVHPARPCLSNTLEHPGITVHLSATPKIHGAMPERVGADLDEVFAIAGLTERLPALLGAGVASRTLATPTIAPATRGG